MQIDVLNIEETEDGGAIVTIELDRDAVHAALEQWFLDAIKSTIADIKESKE